MKLFIALFLALLVYSNSAFALTQVNLASPLTISQTTTSTQALAANPSRTYLIIVNQGTDIIYVKTASVQSGTEGVAIPAGGNWEPPVAPLGTVWMKAKSGTQTVTVIEGN